MARARWPAAASLVIFGVLAVIVTVATAGAVSAATGGWTIASTPPAIVQGVATNIVLTATNTSGGSSVGCVHLQLPSAFAVSSVAVDAVPPAHAWTADPPFGGPAGSTIVQVHAVTEGDVLKVDGDTVVFHITLTGTGPGTYIWPADSRDHANCTSGIDSDSVTVSIVGPASTPTAAPTPTATSTPRPTPTPAPPSTPTPTSRATPIASQTPTSTPAPSSPPSSADTASPTPGSLASPTPSPTAPSTPAPTPAGSADAALPPIAGTGAGNTGGGSGESWPADVAQAQLTIGGTSAATDPAMALSTLTRLDGIIWAVPSLALTVPGLLLLLAVLAQIAAGASWVPVVRRKLGGARILAGGRRSDRDRRA